VLRLERAAVANHRTTRVHNGSAPAPKFFFAPPLKFFFLQAATAAEPKLSPALTPGSLERRTHEPKKSPDEQRRGCAPRGHHLLPRIRK